MNPVCLANWQLGIGVPAGTGNAGIADNAAYQRTRKCYLSRLEIPRDWERLACREGCDRSISTTPNVLEKVLEAARTELGDSPSASTLLNGLESDSFLVREVAAEGLRELGPEGGSGTIISNALVRVLEHTGEKTREHGTTASHNMPELPSWKRLRVKAAHALAFIGKIHILVEALKSQRGEVKVAAAWGIAEFAHYGDQPQEIGDIVQDLREALTAEHQHHEVCKAVVFAFKAAALGSNAVAAAVPELIAVLDSTKTDHRRWQNQEDKRVYELHVMEALGCIGLPAEPAAERIWQRMVNGGNNERSTCRRRTAALALGRMGAVEELQQATSHELQEVREAAAWALEQGAEAAWPLGKAASEAPTSPGTQAGSPKSSVDLEFGFSPTGGGAGGELSFPEPTPTAA